MQWEHVFFTPLPTAMMPIARILTWVGLVVHVQGLQNERERFLGNVEEENETLRLETRAIS